MGAVSSDTQSYWRIETWFPQLSKETVERMFTFCQELKKGNSALNLVNSKSIPHADLIHFADALLAFEPVYKKINKNEPLYDVGSGAGFPGLVIAIAYPDVRVHLVEHDPRRCEFLKNVIAATNTKNAFVVQLPVERLEEGSITQGICRGYASIPKAFLNLRKPFAPGGNMYFMKGSDWPQEVSAVPTQLCSAWSPALFHEYKLPTADASLYVIVAKKNGQG